MQSSNNPTYLKMFDIMERANPPVWANIEEGERRVLQGDYAYLSESSSIEYRVERNCDLMQVGNWLDSKGYGIGLPKGSNVNAIGTSLGLFLYLELAKRYSIDCSYPVWFCVHTSIVFKKHYLAIAFKDFKTKCISL